MIERAMSSSSWRGGGVVVVLASLLAAMLAPSSARAAEPVAAAEQLFQEARVLVAAGDYAAACPKLEASQKLEPAVGTQFNLADCWEHVGRTASAHAMFMQVARIARAAGKFEREKSARERASALEPKLARVRFVVKASAPGLEVFVDDASVAKATWGEAFAIDPGTHRVRATAPDRTPWSASLVAQASQTSELTVPQLVDPRPPAVSRPVVAEPPSAQKTLALVAGGVGVAGLLAGGVAGVVALSSRSTAQRECPSELYAFRCPTEDGTSAWNSATTAGDVSTVAFVIGGAFVAGAAVLWFTAPKARTRVGTSLTGVRLEGSF
jgi:hypothetical protein